MSKIKYHASLIAITVGMLMYISPARTGTINFDDPGLSHLSEITNFYEEVQFHGIPNPYPIWGSFPVPSKLPNIIGGAAIYDQFGLTAPGESPPNIAVGQGQGHQEGLAGILMTFASPISKLKLTGLDWGNYKNDEEAMTLSAYNSSGNLIGKEDFATQFANGAIHGTIEFPGMKYVAFNYTNTLYGFYGIDDLDFTTMPLVILDPGHGLLLGDDGRKHYQRPESPAYGLHEDDLTLAMANEAKQQLENDGYEVVMTRTGPDATFVKSCGAADQITDRIDYCNKDLQDRVAKVQETKKRVGDDRDIVFISIHTNGGNIGRLIKGRTQTFYCFDAASTLADQLLNEIAAIAPPVSSISTGGYQDCDLAVIAKTAGMNIPGSLIEVLYHNNLDDETLLSNPAFLAQAGSGMAKAIKNFIEQQPK